MGSDPTVVVLPTVVAMVAQALIHRWFGVGRLAKNNEIAGFKFATVGVIYAVLLAFSVIVVWEKFSAAEDRGRRGGRARLPPSSVMRKAASRRRSRFAQR